MVVNQAKVAAIAKAIADGLLTGGVLPVLKHLPGHGRASVDSHHKLPVVDTDRATLEAVDFAAFRPLADLPIGMTAHVVFSAIDPVAPATTSVTMVQASDSRLYWIPGPVDERRHFDECAVRHSYPSEAVPH